MDFWCANRFGNSSLTQSSRELEKSTLDGLKSYLRADFSAQPTNLAQDTRIALANNLDSAYSQNLVKKVCLCEQIQRICVAIHFLKVFASFCESKKKSPLYSPDSNPPNKADFANRRI